MYRVVFLLSWRISVGCLAVEHDDSWVKLDLSVGMEAFGWALVYYYFLVLRILWWSKILELSLCLWVLVPVSYGSIKTCPPTWHRRQNPWVNGKQLSIARNTQEDWQSYIEERKWWKEKEVSRRGKGRVKTGEINQVDSQIPKWEWILKVRVLKIQN